MRDGAEPRHHSAGNMNDVGAQVMTLAGSCFCPGSARGWAAHDGVRGTGRPS
jgi:hypothetical protein